MNTAATLLWLSCLGAETIGQLSFKTTAIHSADVAGDSGTWKTMLSSGWIWLGIGCYAVEFFLYMAFLSLVPLAEGVLLSSLSIMTIMVAGRIFFGEKLSLKRVMAGMLVTAGVILIGWT
jgi:drug/metabolite transporter (DMT)-like permease